MLRIVISGMNRKRLYILLFCIAVAGIMNVFGVIRYKLPAKELILQLPNVLLIALILYMVAASFRVIGYLLAKLKKK